ncbi:hypothetical protein LTR08_004841 [Meristemomyces frigidus]|nr:hypothetical protein LTR08_004841 [Meristemomyces frigidus]
MSNINTNPPPMAPYPPASLLGLPTEMIRHLVGNSVAQPAPVDASQPGLGANRTAALLPFCGLAYGGTNGLLHRIASEEYYNYNKFIVRICRSPVPDVTSRMLRDSPNHRAQIKHLIVEVDALRLTHTTMQNGTVGVPEQRWLAALPRYYPKLTTVTVKIYLRTPAQNHAPSTALDLRVNQTKIDFANGCNPYYVRYLADIANTLRALTGTGPTLRRKSIVFQHVMLHTTNNGQITQEVRTDTFLPTPVAMSWSADMQDVGWAMLDMPALCRADYLMIAGRSRLPAVVRLPHVRH